MIKTEINNAIKHVKNPAKIACAITMDDNGKFNSIALEWFMRTSITPPMFAISIAHKRYSYNCLMNNRFFNLIFPASHQYNFVNVSGFESGRDVDKFSLIDDLWFTGNFNGLPILHESAACFECKVISQIRSGDHTIFTGEVKRAWLTEDKMPFLLSDLKRD